MLISMLKFWLIQSSTSQIFKFFILAVSASVVPVQPGAIDILLSTGFPL